MEDLDEAVEVETPEIEASDSGDGGSDSADGLTDLELLEQPDTAGEADQEAPTTDGKTADEKPIEAVTDDAAGKAAAEKAAAASADEVPATVKALRDAVEKSPLVKAELDKNPQLKNMLYANARRSQELNGYKEQFATPELAKYAREGAEDLAQIEGMYFSNNAQGHEQLIQRMAEVSSDGQIEGFFTHQRTEHFWPAVQEYARRQGAEEVVEAVELISDFLGEKKGSAPPLRGKQQTQEQDQLPAHVQQRLAELDTLKRQQGTQTEKATQEYERGVVNDVITSVRTQLKTRISTFAPALSEQAVEKVIDDTLRDINSVASKDNVYQSRWKGLLRKANGTAESKTQLVDLATKYARGVAGPMIQKHVSVFGTAAVQASADRTQKLTAQKAKTDIKGAGGTQAPTRQGDLHQQVRDGRRLSQKLFGRDLTDLEILNIEETLETFQRMAKDRAAR